MRMRSAHPTLQARALCMGQFARHACHQANPEAACPPALPPPHPTALVCVYSYMHAKGATRARVRGFSCSTVHARCAQVFETDTCIGHGRQHSSMGCAPHRRTSVKIKTHVAYLDIRRCPSFSSACLPIPARYYCTAYALTDSVMGQAGAGGRGGLRCAPGGCAAHSLFFTAPSVRNSGITFRTHCGGCISLPALAELRGLMHTPRHAMPRRAI